MRESIHVDIVLAGGDAKLDGSLSLLAHLPRRFTMSLWSVCGVFLILVKAIDEETKTVSLQGLPLSFNETSEGGENVFFRHFNSRCNLPESFPCFPLYL